MVGVAVLARLLNKYDLTMRQMFEVPFGRTLLLETVVTPSWHYPGDITYILADADRANILDWPLLCGSRWFEWR